MTTQPTNLKELLIQGKVFFVREDKAIVRHFVVHQMTTESDTKVAIFYTDTMLNVFLDALKSIGYVEWQDGWAV